MSERVTQIADIERTMKAVAIDESTIEITVTPPQPDPIVTQYTRENLEREQQMWTLQLGVLQNQFDQQTAAVQARLDDVNAKLALCDANGVLGVAGTKTKQMTVA